MTLSNAWINPTETKIWLNRVKHIQHNPKAILRIMNKYGLLAKIRRRRKYKRVSQRLHVYGNYLNRDFHAKRPNQKWVTDISYIHTAQGVLYLSAIRDAKQKTVATEV